MSASNSDYKRFYSSYRKPKIIQYATLKLLEANAHHLLKYIYSKHRSEVFNDAEIRVGLAIKILSHLDRQFDEDIIKPVIDDIEAMMEDEMHLSSTGNPKRRTKSLEEELQFIQQCIDIDDTITLNTELGGIGDNDMIQFQSKRQQNIDDNGCIIM